MINAKNFDIYALSRNHLFYVLDNITATSIEIFRRTPAGDEAFEDAELFIMKNGKLLVAFAHPFKYAGNSCLIAKHDNVEEMINMTPWERLVDVYDTDIENTDQGFFVFCDSKALFDPEVEWRCDNTLYGPHSFVKENGRIVPTINKIKAYETIMSLHNVGYLIYVHLEDDTDIREKYKNNSEVPCVGLTLSEAFKLLNEWSEVTKEPFNSTQDIAVKAKKFLDFFGFTPDLVDNQSDMQVANYLKGSNTARLRPADIVANKPELITFVRKKMASSSLSSLCELYAGLWDIEEVLEAEYKELNEGILRFKEYYQIPQDWELTETERIIEHCTLYVHATVGAYVHNQLRLFINKKRILDGFTTIN
jgi:hypothetical protein